MKSENFELIRNHIRNLEKAAFTNTDIVKAFNGKFNHEQIKRYLKSLEELGEVKYLQTSKLYVRF